MDKGQTILVGAQRYAISYSTSIEDFGYFDMDAAEIVIRAGQSRVSTATTLLHEIVHAISDTLGGGLTEEQVRCVEQGLAMIIQNNPTVFEEISRDLRTTGEAKESPM